MTTLRFTFEHLIRSRMTRKPETLKPINRKQQYPPRPLLEEFSILFYIGKVIGINPQDLREFRKYRRLERSQTGDFYSIVVIVSVVMNFNLMVWVFHDPEYSVEKGEYAKESLDNLECNFLYKIK